MQIHINERLLRRRLWLSVVYMVGSLLFMGGGFLASVASTDPLIQYGASIPPLLVGLFFWSRNQAYLQRWGPRTRQDAVLTHALRGLDARYHLFVAPAEGLPDYLLVGAMGIVVLVPVLVPGAVAYTDNRWRQAESRPWLARWLLWFTVRPVLGNPSAEAERGVERTRRFLADKLPDKLLDEGVVQGLIVFTDPRVNLVQTGGPVPALLIKSLRAHVRHLPRASHAQVSDLAVSALSTGGKTVPNESNAI